VRRSTVQRRGVPFGLWALGLGLGFGVWALGVELSAQIQMPDPSMIAGRALPAPELPDGVVSVRVVREAIGNDLPGQTVTVTAGGASASGTTGEDGRATISGLPVGAEATAEATVDGESLVSYAFEVPSSGGIRIILIAGMEEAAARKAAEETAAAAAPPLQGTVVLGGDSRVVMEFRDDELTVFYVLEIVNTARRRVDIGGPLVFDLPDEAQGATVLEGSTPNATVRDDRVTVTGPFAAGGTPLQIAYRLPHSTDTLTLTQPWPARLEQVLVMVQKLGGLQMSSPQFTEQDEARAGTGVPFMLGGGLALPEGEPLVVRLTGLPAHPQWPHRVALGLAGAVVVIAIWISWGTGRAAGATKRLASRRESLLGELVKLEEQRRAGRVDGGRYATRRQRLVADLERVYGELDGSSNAGPALSRPGGGEAPA